MKYDEIYELISLRFPITKSECEAYVRATVHDLYARFGKKYTESDTEIPLKDAYRSALEHGVLYRITSETVYNTRYVAMADKAYLTVWRDMHETKIRGNANVYLYGGSE